MSSVQFTKHLDASTGRFYYYDHISGSSTWDKPPGDLRVTVNESSLTDDAEISSQRFQPLSYDVQTVIEQKRRLVQADKEFDDENQEKNTKAAWQHALLEASYQNGTLNLAWLDLGPMHPEVYEFKNNFGHHLKKVRMIGMSLKTIPSEFFESAHQIEVLCLNSNQLTSLPDNLTLLTNLRELQVVKNELESLPEKIGLMWSLQRLEVANNKLAKLPITFGALRLLTKVDIECNKLRVLPENLDNLANCKYLNANNNKLIRLPRCVARMPKLISLSASNNEISYIPDELMTSKTLERLRITTNKILRIPERIGDLTQLKELSIDYNKLKILPVSFYKLSNLETLRIEGNSALKDPPPEIIATGGRGVIQYLVEKFVYNQERLKRDIVISMQDALAQAYERGFTSLALFEPNSSVLGDADPWYAFQMHHFWFDLLPMLRKAWRREAGLPIDVNDEHRIRSFVYNELDVKWAFSTFIDAYGPLMIRGKGMFRRCDCKDKDGRRKVCAPPHVNFNCMRECTMVKQKIVRQLDKRERLWQQYKENGMRDAIKRAENEALAYLKSKPGRQWLEEESFAQAEEIVNEEGDDQVDDWRVKAAEKKKAAIIYRYDKLKARVEKARVERLQKIDLDIEELKEKRDKIKAGYQVHALNARITQMEFGKTQMDEAIQIQMLASQCEMECMAVDDEILNESSESEADSEGSSLPDSEDDSPEADDRRRKYDLKLIKEIELERQEMLKAKFKGRVQEVEETGLMIAQKTVGKAVGSLASFAQREYMNTAKLQRRVRRQMRRAVDVSRYRIRKFYLQQNGRFEEVQKELKGEMSRQYINQQVLAAREKAKREFEVVENIREQMGNLGIEKVFKEWKAYFRGRHKRYRRDLRAAWKVAKQEFDASMYSVDLAQLRVEEWEELLDIYTDKQYWRNRLTGETTVDKPGVEHYLPPTFHLPKPPEDLPPDVSIDTTDDESEGKAANEEAGSESDSDSDDDDSDDDDDDSDDDEEKNNEEKNNEENERRLLEDAFEAPGTDRRGSAAPQLSVEGDDNSGRSSVATDTSRQNQNGRPSVASVEGSSLALMPMMWTTGSAENALVTRDDDQSMVTYNEDGEEIKDSLTDLMDEKNRVYGLSGWKVPSTVTNCTAGDMSNSATNLLVDIGLRAPPKTPVVYEYGPDSLRGNSLMNAGSATLALTPMSQKKQEVARLPHAPMLARVAEAREYKEKSQLANVTSGEFILEPQKTDLALVRQETQAKIEEEILLVERRLRRKRTGPSEARKLTYMNTSEAQKQSFANREVLRKMAVLQEEKKVEVGPQGPTTEQLLKLAGGEVDMTNISSGDGMKLRTVLAQRAIYIKKELEDKMAPKKGNPFTRYWAPLWQERPLDDSDESDDEEVYDAERAKVKEERKKKRMLQLKQQIAEKNMARNS